MHQPPISLDFAPEKFSSLLDEAVKLVLEQYEGMHDAKAFAGFSPAEVKSWFDEPIPEGGMAPEDVLKLVKKYVLDTATMNIAPNMYAYVMAGGTQASIISEMFTAAINQNVGKWHLAPSMNELEQLVIKWGAQFIGFSNDAAGVLVSGGSAANLTAMTVARNICFEKQGIRHKGVFGMAPMTVYASSEVHGCVDKSMDMLGLGINNLRKIPIDKDCRIRLDLLVTQIEKDIADGFQPFCLIANGGTVNTGAIDPLTAMAELADKYDMWYHVDGAYGGLAACLDSLSADFEGIELADSVAIDFHKWLYQPFEAGCTLVKNWDKLRRTFYKKADYLSADMVNDGRLDLNEHSFQLSRNAKALKVWMSYKIYGAERLRKAIQNDIDNARYLAELTSGLDDFECCNDPKLSITCFRYLGPDAEKREDKAWVDALNEALTPALEKDGRVFIAGTQLHGQPVIRACCINHRMTHQNIDKLVRVVRQVGTDVAASLASKSGTLQQNQ
ncbi:MAG: pyridoxal-dependent decarboxylase [Bacteroidota bacterium]